jgi:large subunit ribosomal protein L24|tara:strand:- start:1101 stop:1421 length:321 start_codon:yes stop_codon:yes gene_type:complete
MSKAKLRVKKGDQVVVVTGRDKGAKGEVTKVMPSDNRVLVSGVNMVTKHKKPTQFAAGGIEKVEAPIHVSNVALIDPKSEKATRVGYKTDKDGNKTRVACSSGEEI